MSHQSYGPLVGVPRILALLDRHDLHESIQPVRELRRHLGFGVTRIAFAEQRLAVEIGDFDDVIVDDRQLADTCPGKRRENRAADSSRADHSGLASLR